MAEDEATKEVSLDEEIPVDDVLADAQETLDGIEGADGGGEDLGSGGTGGTSAGAGLDDDLTGSSTTGSGDRPATSDRSTGTSSGGGLLPSPSMPSDLFSTKYFLIAGLLAAAGGIGGTIFLPIPIVGTAVGLLAAGFLLGLASGRSSYVEVGLTTGLVGAALVFIPALLSLPVGGLGVPLFAIGGGGALLLGLIGHYFGRDLRSGLTRDVDGGSDDGFV